MRLNLTAYPIPFLDFRRDGASGRPHPTNGDPLQSGRVRTPAPTLNVEAFLSFCRGRSQTGPPYLGTSGGAHPRVASLGLRPIHLQPLPYRFQGHLPRLGRGAPWGSRREACKPRSHPHPSRPSVVPPYPFCPFGTFPPDSGNRPSPLKGEGLRAGEDTRPYGIYRNCPFFRRGRTLAGPQMYAARPGGRALRFSTSHTCSAYSGADAEPQQRQFFQPQGPVARWEFRPSLRFCAPEILLHFSSTRPP